METFVKIMIATATSLLYIGMALALFAVAPAGGTPLASVGFVAMGVAALLAGAATVCMVWRVG